MHGLAQGKEYPTTHPLNGPLKGWHATRINQQYRVTHKFDGDDLMVAHVGPHDYDKAAQRVAAQDLSDINFIHEPQKEFNTVTAWSGDKFVGSLGWHHQFPKGGLNVQVEPEYQRRGIATEMLRRAREHTPELSHSSRKMQSDDGAAWAAKVAFTPTKRVFTHTDGLDHRLWDGEKIRPEVREHVLAEFEAFAKDNYLVDWQKYCRIYFAGSEASEWTSSTLEGNNDFDTLVGVSYHVLRDEVSWMAETSDADITDWFNMSFKDRMNNSAEYIEVDGVKTGPWDHTWYVNPDSWDIRLIKPYAAYELVANKWWVNPAHLPHWSLKDFPAEVVTELRAVERYVKAVLNLPEPLRTQQGSSLFTHLHSDRSRAFSDRGEGWYDPANLIEKWLDQEGLWPELVNCKHRWDQGLGLTPVGWDNEHPFGKSAGAAGPDHSLEFKHMTGKEYGLPPEMHSQQLLYAKNKNAPEDGYLGHIQYSHQPGDSHSDQSHVHIENLDVWGEHRRRGVASGLMSELQSRHPGTPIFHGGRTPHGKQWAQNFYGTGDDNHVTLDGRTANRYTVRVEHGHQTEDNSPMIHDGPKHTTHVQVHVDPEGKTDWESDREAELVAAQMSAARGLMPTKTEIVHLEASLRPLKVRAAVAIRKLTDFQGKGEPPKTEFGSHIMDCGNHCDDSEENHVIHQLLHTDKPVERDYESEATDQRPLMKKHNIHYTEEDGPTLQELDFNPPGANAPFNKDQPKTHQDIREIHPHDMLHTNQDMLHMGAVEHYRKNGHVKSIDGFHELESQEKPVAYHPVVSKHNGKLWLEDGHHRTMAARMQGKSIHAYFHDFDAGQSKTSSRADDLYGSNDVDKLFNGNPMTVAPWPGAGRKKSVRDYDPETVGKALRDPESHMGTIDPRELRSTQPAVTRGGVSHYMQSDEIYADKHKPENSTPIVYRRSDGQNLILTGHHRATRALLKGEPHKAIIIHGPWGPPRTA